LALARVAPKFQGIASPGRWACTGIGTSPVGERSSARPTQAGGPCLLLVVIPRRTSFTVGPTTSVTTPGTVGGCSVQRPHCSGPSAPHTLPHPDQAGCTARRRNAGSPRSAHQLTTEDQHSPFSPPGCRHLGAGAGIAFRMAGSSTCSYRERFRRSAPGLWPCRRHGRHPRPSCSSPSAGRTTDPRPAHRASRLRLDAE
jgi:hypothetical protein